jgi:hypothetical protein
LPAGSVLVKKPGYAAVGAPGGKPGYAPGSALTFFRFAERK